MLAVMLAIPEMRPGQEVTLVGKLLHEIEHIYVASVKVESAFSGSVSRTHSITGWPPEFSSSEHDASVLQQPVSRLYMGQTRNGR